MNIDLAGHAVDSALEAVDRTGRRNDDRTGLDLECVPFDGELRHPLLDDECLLIRMPVRGRTLTATTADDEEGDVRAVFPADEERRCLVERDVFDADDRHDTSLSRKA